MQKSCQSHNNPVTHCAIRGYNISPLPDFATGAQILRENSMLARKYCAFLSEMTISRALFKREYKQIYANLHKLSQILS